MILVLFSVTIFSSMRRFRTNFIVFPTLFSSLRTRLFPSNSTDFNCKKTYLVIDLIKVTLSLICLSLLSLLFLWKVWNFLCSRRYLVSFWNISFCLCLSSLFAWPLIVCFSINDLSKIHELLGTTRLLLPPLIDKYFIDFIWTVWNLHPDRKTWNDLRFICRSFENLLNS